MNKVILTLLVALATSVATFAQYYGGEAVGTVYTYEANAPMTGTITVTQTFTGKEGNKLAFKVVTPMPSGEKMEATNTYILKDGKFYIDMQNLIEATKASLAASMGTSDLEMSFTGDAGFIPVKGKVGDKFPSYQFTLTAKVMGMSIDTTSEVNRNEFVREEEITTPLGKMKTIVLETEGKTIVSAMGQTQEIPTKITQWIVPGKGVIKQTQSMSGQNIVTTLVSIK